MKKEPLSKAERWERTHETLRLTAARLLRTRGLRLPSVADVMKGAKLTVGGFYGHWESKEALFEEALREALRGNWSTLVEQSRGETTKSPPNTAHIAPRMKNPAPWSPNRRGARTRL